MNPLQFKLTAESVEVTLGDKAYVMTEMTAAVRDNYLDGLTKRMKTDAAGKATGISKFEGMQADLLTHCLKTKDGTAVTSQEIQSWPASTVSSLFKAAQELNQLSLTEEPAKKE